MPLTPEINMDGQKQIIANVPWPHTSPSPFVLYPIVLRDSGVSGLRFDYSLNPPVYDVLRYVYSVHPSLIRELVD